MIGGRSILLAFIRLRLHIYLRLHTYACSHLEIIQIVSYGFKS